MDQAPPTLLSLPYDIRFMIYQHLFPSSPQIYLQALQDQTIKAILAEGTVPTSILLVCRAIHSEAAGYLYNTYIFNLIGAKEDCIRAYRGFSQTLQLHAREKVHITAFSNGVHSETMCLSLHTGAGKLAILRRRRRGIETTLDEIRAEIRAQRGSLRKGWDSWAAGVLTISTASLLVVLLGFVLQQLVSA